MAVANDNPLIVVEGVSKRFGVTQALSDVSVTFLAGEVHALMGENGAGKSTLGKVIAGLHRQDEGVVKIEGRALRPGSLDDAYAAGIRIVHQELAQCPNLSVAENLCLHDMPRGKFGLVDRRAMEARAAKLVHQLEPGIDVAAPLGTLSPGWRQICQIAASLDQRAGDGGSGPRVIVFDEPTSSLSISEVERLLSIVRELARRGLTILYVSHRMGEIFSVCDRVTVLRDGRYIATSNVREIDEPTLVEQMIGRRLATPTGRDGADPHAAAFAESAGDGGVGGDGNGQNGNGHGDPGAHVRTIENAPDVLVVEGLDSPGKLEGIGLKVRAGEIVGVGGLVGSGRSELLDAIFGLDPRSRGVVRVSGVALAEHEPRAAIRAGMGYVPEDRKLQGLFFQLGIDENIVAPVMSHLAGFGGIRNLGEEESLVGERMRAFQVKAASASAVPGSLSGGNQQKLLLARWMGKETRVLLLDEPTRGIDVGTKSEIYKIVKRAAASGLAVLLVSSEMPELLHLSDRILVMCDGRISGALSGAEMTQANILRLATIDDGMPSQSKAEAIVHA